MADEERMHEEEELEGHVPAEREASLLNLRTLLIAVAGLIGMIIFIQLISAIIFFYFRSAEPGEIPGRPPVIVTQPPAGPGLQIAPADDLLRIRATEQARLEGYGWIDQEDGLVHIPIERAMEILAERGLPVSTDENAMPQERINADESGFPNPSQIPFGTPGPQGTPLLEITVPAELLASPTPEQAETETNPAEAGTDAPDGSGTPEAFAPLFYVSHGSGDESGQVDPFESVRYDQNLNGQLPMDTFLVDETGQIVQIKDFFNGKPVILVFAYYECPMLCTLVLNELTRAMGSIDMDIGDQFEVITISIDSRETHQLAYSKKMTYLNEYDRPDAEDGWHFLTGEETAIQSLTEAAGFRYVYDEELDQYAHPAGVLILTPGGRIARYLSGLDLPPKDLRLALVEASSGRIGSAVDRFFLLCYAYDPVFGRYNLVIKNVLTIASLLTVLLLGSVVSFLLWRERRKAMMLPVLK